MTVDLLGLSDIYILTKHEHGEDICLEVETKEGQKPSCHSCAQDDQVYRHGTRQQLVMDLPMHNKRVGLKLTRRRWRCKACKTTFFQPLEWLDDTRRMTRRLVEFIQGEALLRPFTNVAQDVGVDEATIRNIFNEHAKSLESNFKVITPRILGIDEIHLLSRPRCVLTNIETRTIIDILPSRKRDVVERYLMGLDHKEIECVTADMWADYHRASSNILPSARMVVDKFHVVRMANQCLDAVRKAVGRTHKQQSRSLMRKRFLLLKRERDLDERGLLLLQALLESWPQLKEAHALKEGFFAIYEASGRKEGKKAYEMWLNAVQGEMRGYFQPLIRATQNYLESVLAYYDCPITNAYTESLNRLIRSIHRKGRGYSFKALRAKILFSPDVKRKTHRYVFGDSTVMYYMPPQGRTVESSQQAEAPPTFGVHMDAVSDWFDESGE